MKPRGIYPGRTSNEESQEQEGNGNTCTYRPRLPGSFEAVRLPPSQGKEIQKRRTRRQHRPRLPSASWPDRQLQFASFSKPGEATRDIYPGRTSNEESQEQEGNGNTCTYRPQLPGFFEAVRLPPSQGKETKKTDNNTGLGFALLPGLIGSFSLHLFQFLVKPRGIYPGRTSNEESQEQEGNGNTCTYRPRLPGSFQAVRLPPSQGKETKKNRQQHGPRLRSASWPDRQLQFASSSKPGEATRDTHKTARKR